MRQSDRFDINQLFETLTIPPDEQEEALKALKEGLTAHYHYTTGDAPIASLSLHLLQTPFVAGFGVVEAIRSTKLSIDTRKALVKWVLQTIDPTEKSGIPFGLPVMLSFLASVSALSTATFRTVMLAARSDRHNLFDALKAPELVTLLDWLLETADLSQAEQIWWLQFLACQLDKAHLGDRLTDHVLHHPYPSDAFKRQVCHAWLSQQAMGDRPMAREVLKTRIQIGESAFEAMVLGGPPRSTHAPDDDVDPLDLSQLLPLIPNYMKRRAVLGLAQSGEPPLTVCQTYLNCDRGYDTQALDQGVADVLQLYRSHFSDKELQDLIEKGLTSSVIETRKTFYRLGTELIDTDYLARAREDEASAIRDWAIAQIN